MSFQRQSQNLVDMQLDVIRTRFIAALTERLDRMERWRDIVDEDRKCREPLMSIRMDAHKTVGVAKTLGFPELGSLAREVETALDGFLETDASWACDDILLSKIDDMLGEMALVVEGDPAA